MSRTHFFPTGCTHFWHSVASSFAPPLMGSSNGKAALNAGKCTDGDGGVCMQNCKKFIGGERARTCGRCKHLRQNHFDPCSTCGGTGTRIVPCSGMATESMVGLECEGVHRCPQCWGKGGKSRTCTRDCSGYGWTRKSSTTSCNAGGLSSSPYEASYSTSAWESCDLCGGMRMACSTCSYSGKVKCKYCLGAGTVHRPCRGGCKATGLILLAPGPVPDTNVPCPDAVLSFS